MGQPSAFSKLISANSWTYPFPWARGRKPGTFAERLFKAQGGQLSGSQTFFSSTNKTGQADFQDPLGLSPSPRLLPTQFSVISSCCVDPPLLLNELLWPLLASCIPWSYIFSPLSFPLAGGHVNEQRIGQRTGSGGGEKKRPHPRASIQLLADHNQAVISGYKEMKTGH